MDDTKCLFKATIPVQGHASKKNNWQIQYNRKTQQRYIGADSRTKKAADLLLLQLRQRAIDDGITEPLKGRMRGLFLFGFPREKFYTSDLKESQNMGDCSNLVQIVEDCLQKAGIIENDFWLAPITIDRVVSKTMCVHIELYSQPLPEIQLSLEAQ